jgi:hypothetical protein
MRNSGGDEERRLTESSPGWGDEDLLAALRQAFAARRAVPHAFVQAGQDAFAWHDIDAELAQLTYDSTRLTEPAMATRAPEEAAIRVLTFTSAQAGMQIELEVQEDALAGQILPMQSAAIELQTKTGTQQPISADEVGCFWISPIPREDFRLRCRPVAGDAEVVTVWVRL